MTHKYFNFGDVLGYGWRVMKTNLWFFVGLGLLFMIITYLPTIARFILKETDWPKAARITAEFSLIIAGWVINITLAIGLIKIALSFCNEQRPPISTLFDARGCFWRYVAAGILYGLIMLAGFILLIVPGIIWSIKFGLCFYFVIDKGLGPIEALKASSRTTMGVKWQLFGFGILCSLINLLGVLCLVVGVFATYPMVLVASALVYRQLLAQTPEIAEFGIATPIAALNIEPSSNQQEF
jgi:hypothetical protein